MIPQWLPAHPTLKNFWGVLDAMPFWRYYWNTLVVAFGILGVQLVTITLAAYAFARMEFWGRASERSSWTRGPFPSRRSLKRY